jgi:peptide deformylase
MAIKPILQLGDPRLRQVCEVVRDFSVLPALVEDLQDTLQAARENTGYGRAIAAPANWEI